MIRFFRQPGAWVPLAMLATVAVYWFGLRGPLLLDDHYNLEVIQRWLAGEASLHDVVFGGKSGTFGRPLAMASLALNAWIGGYQPFAFKLGNLLVHLLCGLAVYGLVARMAGRNEGLRDRAELVAALVASIWLLHPLNASTVLYAVQRMAQLSVLCMLLGMWLYMAMRERQARGAPGATTALFIGIPLLTALGFLSKENALLLPALCLVLELGCFRGSPRPRVIRFFYAAFLLLPVALGLALFARNPGRITGGYLIRDFTWWERGLTEARALCDYLWKIVVPNPPTMGVYTDDYAISTGLLSPPTTLAAILVLAAITIAAWRLRQRVPALAVGWGFFLVGHAIESSILPLEPYFEHRNYLPMVGVLYAFAGIIAATASAIRTAGLRPNRIGAVAVVAGIALLVIGTHGRARVWSTPETLALSAVASHPQSLRANMALVKVALDHRDREAMGRALQRVVSADNPRTRALGHLNRLYLSCALDKKADPNDLHEAVAAMPPRMTYAEPEIFELLYERSDGCKGIDDTMLGNAMDTLLDRAHSQPDGMWTMWRLRHVAARFYARAGNWQIAREQAQLAWQPGSDVAAADLLVRAQLATGDIAGAERTYREAAARVDPGNAQDAAGLEWLRGRIDAAGRDHQEPQDGMQGD